jgi:altronate hydrolase
MNAVCGALRLHPDDNVAVALAGVRPGDCVNAGGDLELRAIGEIRAGHKIALRRISAGASVVKYGATVGVATRDILAGEHVHAHNVESARLRGDR